MIKLNLPLLMMKIKLFLSISSVFLLLMACSPSEESKKETPKGIIQEDEMVLILADMQITEAYLADIRKTSKRLKDSTLLYYQKVYHKYGIDKATFEKSILYYKQDLQNLEQIYTRVVVRLNELKAKNEEILLEMKADSIRRDSIEKALIIQDSIRIADSLALIHDTLIIK